MGFDPSIFVDADSVNAYSCGICHDIIVEAHDALCGGGHLFCRSCLTSWLSNHTTCPTCQQDSKLDSITANHFVDRVVRQAMVQCDCVTAGCIWRGMLSERNAHLNACPLVSVPCPYDVSGCRIRVVRTDLSSHTQVCDWRPEMQLVSCKFPGCEAKVRRMDFKQHAQECKFHPERQLLKCPFPGCAYNGVRGDMPSHFLEKTNDHFAQYLNVWVQEHNHQKQLASEVKRHREEMQREAEHRNAEDEKEEQRLLKMWEEHKPICVWTCRSDFRTPHGDTSCFVWGPIKRQWDEVQLQAGKRRKPKEWRYHPSMKLGLCKICHMDAECAGCVTMAVLKHKSGKFRVTTSVEQE